MLSSELSSKNVTLKLPARSIELVLRDVEYLRRLTNRAVVLLSGGVDSSTLTWLFAKRFDFEVHALTMLYGQKHTKEVESAKAVAEAAGVKRHVIVDLSHLSFCFEKSSLVGPSEVPAVSTDGPFHEAMRSTVVPNRNMVLLSVAAAYALTNDIHVVAYAAHWSDRGVYPDCRPQFVTAVQHAIQVGNDDPSFRVVAPFVDIEKWQIVRLGASIGVPYELTWSCYRGGEVHCGVCSSCVQRKEAFRRAGVPDPTVYER